MMTTTTARTSQRPDRGLPPFRTPVRGHAYAPRLPETAAPRPGQPARLVPEPDNPADPHAVAVWVEDGSSRWRIGYLDRGVAVRVAPRLRAGLTLSARIDGWVGEPEGRWQRPVVLLRPQETAPLPGSSGEAGGESAGPGGDRPRLGATGAGARRVVEPARPAGRVGGRAGAGADPGGRQRRGGEVWGRPPGVVRRTLGPASGAGTGG